MSNARRNDASGADIDFRRIFASGAFKNVYLGNYSSGPRRGEQCVAKNFKPQYRGSRYEVAYFRKELEVVHLTRKIAERFNHADVVRNAKIGVNIPDIWLAEDNRQPYLVESMIEGFEKFNSNTGWTKGGSSMSDLLQALSHFSFDDSEGRYLLCDVQGGEIDYGFILTDPVIMSITGGFGPGDLGADGIYQFFRGHRCTRFCKRDWLKPSGSGRGAGGIEMRRGTIFPRR